MKTLKNQQDDGKLETAKSLRYFHSEAGAEGVQEAANQYASASLIAAGAGNAAVAMLSTLYNLTAALLYTKVPTVVQKVGSRKKAVVFLSFLDAICWLPLIAILLFLRPVNPIWLIPCWIINMIPGMLVFPARSSWLADLVPAHRRGRYFAMRSAISGATYIGTFYIFGYVLPIFNGQLLYGFALIFLVAFVATFICFLIYSRIHNTAVAVEKDTNFGFFDFLLETRRRNLGRFILFVASFQFTVYIATPFFTPYMLRDLHFSYIFFAMVFSTEFLAKVVIVNFWGRYADKAGNLKVMRFVSLAIPFVPLLWLASQNVIYLVFVQLFSGACWAGFELCSSNFIYEAAPQGKRLKYISYHKALSTLFMALGALAGAYLLGVVRPVFGYEILALFVLSGVLRLTVTMVMFPKLREVRGRTRSYPEEPAMEPAPAWATVSRPGLFHRPAEWAYFGRPLAPEPIPVQAQTGAIPTNRGLFYRPKEWAYFSKPAAFASLPIQDQTEPVATGRGLFYRPREWEQFRQPLASKKPPVQAQPRSETVAANWGLFYRPGEWTMFGRPLAHAPLPIQTQTETETTAEKRSLLHRPQEWFRSKRAIHGEKNIVQWGQLQPALVSA